MLKKIIANILKLTLLFLLSVFLIFSKCTKDVTLILENQYSQAVTCVTTAGAYGEEECLNPTNINNGETQQFSKSVEQDEARQFYIYINNVYFDKVIVYYGDGEIKYRIDASKNLVRVY